MIFSYPKAFKYFKEIYFQLFIIIKTAKSCLATTESQANNSCEE